MIGLYAIVLRAPEGVVGARAEPLGTVACGGLCAVTGEAPPPLSVEALRAHEAAVRRIAQATDACLPARFGAAAPDEEALAAELSARAPELLAALQLVRGCEQMTLRVHGSAASSALAAAASGTRYLEDRRRARRMPELDPLRAALGERVRAERIERHLQPGLLASVFHLIDRGSAPAYQRVVEATRLDGLRITVSGPWPAWSFAPEVAAP